MYTCLIVLYALRTVYDTNQVLTIVISAVCCS